MMHKTDAGPTDEKTVLKKIKAAGGYLAFINSGLEALVFSDLPDHVMPHLIRLYQAEQEARQILRDLERMHVETV